MTLDDIKAAVDAGQTVHWVHTGYVVHKDRLGQYLISFLPNGSCIGLTDREGHRLNGKEAEFFIAQSKDAAENPGRQSRSDGQERGAAPGGAAAHLLRRHREAGGGA